MTSATVCSILHTAYYRKGAKMPRWIQVGEVSFGGRAEGKSQRITVTLPSDIADELMRESVDRTTTVSAVVREAVTAYFAQGSSEVLPDFVGMVDGDDPTASERIEEIIGELVEQGAPKAKKRKH